MRARFERSSWTRPADAPRRPAPDVSGSGHLPLGCCPGEATGASCQGIPGKNDRQNGSIVKGHVRDRLYEIYWQLEKRIAPGLQYSQSIYEGVLRNHIADETRWLDLGCGHQVLPAWRSAEEQHIVGRSRLAVGLDYELKALKEHQSLAVRVRGDITRLPFKDNSFTLVTANMVLEHLDSPAIQCREIQRVLAPEGILLCHTPNVLGYTTILARLIPQPLRLPLIALLEGRKEEDVFKTHYRANSPRRLTEIARVAGFEPPAVRAIVSTATFAVLTPLALLELLWIRLLMTPPFRLLRTNLIAAFRKPGR